MQIQFSLYLFQFYLIVDYSIFFYCHYHHYINFIYHIILKCTATYTYINILKSKIIKFQLKSNHQLNFQQESTQHTRLYLNHQL
jgi:hypothetical protein